MPLLSVIIPVYNVEAYLQKCVDSVINQNFSDIEVVLVDDGSPDNCPQICDEYVVKDKRIKVIHKKNGGLSEARNYGIKAATGTYIMFLDSDDYWEGEDCLKNIASRLSSGSSIDVLIHGCTDYLVNQNKKIISRTGYNKTLIRNSKKEEVLNYFFKSGLFPGSAWTTVSRRAFILENDIFFIQGIKAEDIDWLLNLFLKAEEFDAIDDTFYIYLKYRTESITGTSDIKSMNDVLFTIEKWFKEIQKEEYIKIKAAVLGYLAFQLGTVLVIASKFDHKQRKLALSSIRKHSFLLKYSISLKTKVVYYMYQLLGLELTIIMVGILHQTKRKFR